MTNQERAQAITEFCYKNFEDENIKAIQEIMVDLFLPEYMERSLQNCSKIYFERLVSNYLYQKQ